MQILINIPEWQYNAIKGFAFDNGIVINVITAVKNGIVLPKGHGRLIDADKLYDDYLKEPEEINGGCSFIGLFREAKTIIEKEN